MISMKLIYLMPCLQNEECQGNLNSVLYDLRTVSRMFLSRTYEGSPV
jgi:hypothetical protein